MEKSSEIKTTAVVGINDNIIFTGTPQECDRFCIEHKKDLNQNDRYMLRKLSINEMVIFN